MILTSSNYYSREAAREYMSVSQFKSFEVCQEMAMAEIEGKWERERTTALMVGSYVDAHFEGTLDVFRAQNPELFCRDGSLKAPYVGAEDIISRLERDALFMDYMSGQKQVIMVGEIAGVKVKIKVDVLHPERIVDLKIMRDFAPVWVDGARLPWFEAWRYDLQGAVYQEIVRQNTGTRLPFYIAAATKERVPDLDIIHIRQDILDFELERFSENVGTYDAIKRGLIPPERCGKCDWCKFSKVLTAPTECDEYNEAVAGDGEF